MTLAWYYTGMPCGDELVYNYITSVVSSDQEIVLEYAKGRSFSHLLVD